MKGAERKRRTRWGRLVLGTVLLAVVWLTILAALTVSFGEKRSEEPADAAIVLGAAVVNDQPSPVFAARLDHAVDLFERRIVSHLILTGGIGAGDTRAESEVGRSYATARGVPDERIFTETVSRTTLQNLVEARRVMADRGFATCLIVSDPLHMRRVFLMAEDLRMDARPSPTPTSQYRTWRTQLGFLARELYFQHHYWIRGE
jgi:uncharacterized SAM-binding protein YcdF (DUF218 family)